MTKKRIGRLPLHRSYGNGITVKYLPTNRAWAVLWHREVLRVGSYDEMTRYASDLVRASK